MKYEKGLVVFMDILGFKNYICNEKKEVGKIFSIFNFAEKIKYLYNTSNMNGVKIEFFSDSFVLTTTEVSMDSFVSIMISCLLVNMQLFKETGLCTRGAVVIGEFFHEQGIVFGPGIVNAYLLESEKAKSIRMLVDENVVKVVNNTAIIQRSKDGYNELNWFMLLIQDSVKDNEYQREIGIELANKYRESLLELIRKYKDTSVYDKYLSLIYQYNNFCNIMEQCEGGYIELTIKESDL